MSTDYFIVLSFYSPDNKCQPIEYLATEEKKTPPHTVVEMLISVYGLRFEVL